MEALLAGHFPWAKLRQGQKLLRLANKYSRERLDAACRRALFFELINVRRVEEILKRALDREAQGPPTSPPGQLVLLPPPRFLRATHHFTHERKEPDHGDQPVTEDRPQTPEALGTAPDSSGSPGLREEGEAP
jgi:hypothetical protein